MVSHLGKNPKKGGKPPKERKEQKIANFLKKLIFRENPWLIKNKLYVFIKYTTVIEKKQ